MKIQDLLESVNSSLLGGNRPTVFYHSSDHNFDEFDLSKSSKTAIMGPGIYLTEDSDEVWGKHRKAYHVIAKNPITLREYPGDRAMAQLSEFMGRELDSVPLVSLENRYGSISEGLRAAGFDAILHSGPSNKPHLLVYSNEQLIRVNSHEDN